MKRSIKISLMILSFIIIIFCIVFFFEFSFPIFKMFRKAHSQMLAGQKYMDSLTEKDFQIWAERTQKYLSNFNSTNWLVEGENIPAELKEIKILNIQVDSNLVDYVWMGGFDHTMLHAERLTNGQFEFTAVYNDHSNRVIWPKR